VSLYEYANESQLRTALIERNLRELATELSDLRRTLAEVVGAAATILPTADTVVTISPDDVSPFAMGFFAREFGNDRPYRWTGDGDVFELRITLNRSCDWQFIMHADPAHGVELGLLKAFVDYAEIPLQIIPGANHVHGVVPRKLFSNQLVLSFYHRQKSVPNQQDPSNPDNRSLCLAFYELKLSPELSQPVVLQPVDAVGRETRKGRRETKVARK
jgi:hypothetical protein